MNKKNKRKFPTPWVELHSVQLDVGENFLTRPGFEPRYLILERTSTTIPRGSSHPFFSSAVHLWEESFAVLLALPCGAPVHRPQVVLRLNHTENPLDQTAHQR